MAKTMNAVALMMVAALAIFGGSPAAAARHLLTHGEVEYNGMSIAEVAAANNLTTLVAAIVALGGSILEAATNPNATLTVFAPTNEAFEMTFHMLNVTAADVLADKALLEIILSFHISLEDVKAADFKKHKTVVTTLLGQDLKIYQVTVKDDCGTKTRTPMVKGFKTKAMVLAADVMAGNSIVHVIDKVLIPNITAAM